MDIQNRRKQFKKRFQCGDEELTSLFHMTGLISISLLLFIQPAVVISIRDPFMVKIYLLEIIHIRQDRVRKQRKKTKKCIKKQLNKIVSMNAQGMQFPNPKVFMTVWYANKINR